MKQHASDWKEKVFREIHKFHLCGNWKVKFTLLGFVFKTQLEAGFFYHLGPFKSLIAIPRLFET